MNAPKEWPILMRAAVVAVIALAANLAHAGPYVFWLNNDCDRWHDVDCNMLGLNCDHEQDDLGPTEIAKLPAYQRVPDCNYVNAPGQRVIPCTRDLEDFARLWMAGVTSNLVAQLPTNGTLTLSWQDYEGDPAIDLFAAADPDGGTRYQTDPVIASNQIDTAQCPYIGRVSTSHPVTFTKSTWSKNQFIWCGVRYGGGALTLTIADGTGNTIGQTKTYIDLVDIKQMYERWTVGESIKLPVRTVPLLGVEGLGTLTTGQPAAGTQFGAPDSQNQPYILYVHGWNMETWEKDRFAETAFKRLYWQGYQGRFGAFRWPTGNKFSGVISAARDADNYDNSESNSWASATGLLNLLTNLDSKYQAGNVYVIAHSMGNVVTGEALRKAGTSVVNTYIAMMAAIQSHSYDGAATNRSLGIWNSHTPDNYAHYWRTNDPPYFNSSAGAGTYVNFYNTNDYALGMWNMDQNLKPDLWLNYGYDGANYFQGITFPNVARLLLLPVDTYEIFAYCDQAPCYALGATPNVGGRFTTSAQQNLIALWPADIHPAHDYSAHVWHSAQFRSDYMSQNAYWHQIMRTLQLLSPL